MNPGSIFFDEDFSFHDGLTGEKLFIVLGTIGRVSVVAKTTSQQHGRGTVFGCQPMDRFHNFFIPYKACCLNRTTWVCLDEFYELDPYKMLKKALDLKIKPVGVLENGLLRLLQDCAMISLDLSEEQQAVVAACLV